MKKAIAERWVAALRSGKYQIYDSYTSLDILYRVNQVYSPSIEHQVHLRKLTTVDKLTFPEIADIIEAGWEDI